MSLMNDNVEFLSFPMYKSRLSLFESLPKSQGGMIFVGDSLTQRNQWDEYLPHEKIINRGIDSDRTLGVLQRMDHIIELKPKKIFLMIGINDIYDNRNQEYMLNNIRQIILNIKGNLMDTELYIQSILPVNNSVYEHQINNDDVVQYNAKLKKLAEDHHIPFVDLYSRFVVNGELDAKYTVDGCHLSGEGYENWVEGMKHLLNESI